MKKILHLMTKLPDKYNGKFVEISSLHLSEYQHYYVALVSDGTDLAKYYPEQANILDLNSLGKISKWKKIYSLLSSKDFELNVFHGLFYTGPFLAFIAFLFTFFKLGDKSLWMTWGGDIYYFQNRPKNFLGWINELFRKRVIRKFFAIASPLDEELKLISLNYKTSALHLNLLYPNPIGIEKSPEKKIEKGKPVKILAGNSADPQNNHLEIFHRLENLKNDVVVYCILSYAVVDLSYRDQVIKKGYDIFGENFIPILDFMGPEKYKELLNDIDISIFFHNRQQAMGNIYQFLYSGKCVFLRKDTLSSVFLKRIGFNIYDSNSLIHLNKTQLMKLIESEKKNTERYREIIEEYFDTPAVISVWENGLEKLFAYIKKSH
ncbi:TDP-N-acetylfucosamine:lipid II N-acetylfucosaminyltransferase [Pseudoalteromonas fenneropenaei]|uniref:TDP-N-acetylfucosamine:lipid II N-acetylfucosaminyltransferase n=1 Tax=Pseudoalteromonas fenneropenaei TaxID=1737459 RepID=A0ABV7CKQ0_9GAMM